MQSQRSRIGGLTHTKEQPHGDPQGDGDGAGAGGKMLGLIGPEAKGAGSHQEVEGFSLRGSPHFSQ